jgi:hypothetical protein
MELLIKPEPAAVHATSGHITPPKTALFFSARKNINPISVSNVVNRLERRVKHI